MTCDTVEVQGNKGPMAISLSLMINLSVSELYQAIDVVKATTDQSLFGCLMSRSDPLSAGLSARKYSSGREVRRVFAHRAIIKDAAYQPLILIFLEPISRWYWRLYGSSRRSRSSLKARSLNLFKTELSRPIIPSINRLGESVVS